MAIKTGINNGSDNQVPTNKSQGWIFVVENGRIILITYGRNMMKRLEELQHSQLYGGNDYYWAELPNRPGQRFLTHVRNLLMGLCDMPGGNPRPNARVRPEHTEMARQVFNALIDLI